MWRRAINSGRKKVLKAPILTSNPFCPFFWLIILKILRVFFIILKFLLQLRAVIKNPRDSTKCCGDKSIVVVASVGKVQS